jgi:vancomycin resistance protein VanJ
MIRALARLVGVAYLALTAGLFALPFAVPDMYRGLLRTLLALLLLAALPVLALVVLCRHRRLALLTGVPVVGLALVYGPYLLPRSAAPAAMTGRQLTVLTFNLQGTTSELDVLAEIIREAEADVVGLQELSREAAEYLRRELRDSYAYAALYPQDNPMQGQGILSRLTISDETYWQDQVERPLGNLRVELDTPGIPIVFYSVHPTPPFSLAWGLNAAAHHGAVADLIDRVRGENRPVVIVGDFNMTDQFPAYGRLTGDLGLVDAFRAAGSAGLGFTFPAGQRLPLPPLLRLDYIFHDSRLAASDARVFGRSGPSDHLPVVARLWLPAQAE